VAVPTDADRLTRLLDAGRALVAEVDLDAVLYRLLDTARELTGAHYAAIGVLDAERKRLARFLTSGLDEAGRRAIGDPPHGRGVLGVLIHDPRPLRLHEVGRHPRSYGFPAGHPPMTTFLGVPLLLHGEAWGNLYLTDKAGGDFDEADEHVITVLADWAAIAIEHANLYEGMQRRTAELEQAVQGLEATTTIVRAVGSETDLGRVLELVVKRGRALVEARAVLLLLAEGDELRIAAGAGGLDAAVVGGSLPARGSVAGQVLAAGGAERIGDVGARLAPADAGLGVIGAQTAVFVPLIYRTRPLGVLCAFDRLGEDGRFGDRDEQLLSAFAASAATAVATAKSVEAERLRHSLRSAEQERRRWARELHDETLQGLAALGVLISSGLRVGGAGLEQAARQVQEQITTEVANLRALIAELRPPALDELGLTAAIESLAERTATVEGLEVDLEVAIGEERLDPEAETAAYRLVQEALTNVAKHARADRVAVRVHAAGERLALEVTDDGRGFDAARPGAGFGLEGMRERAGLMGGTLHIASGEAGTTVRVELPVGPRREPTDGPPVTQERR
jgi:two-component system, NarL family, sensor histidine kinase DevS